MRFFTLLLFLMGAAHCHAQLNGAYSVPGSFTSVASAISNLNTYGVSGAVTINISAGHTETAVTGGYTLYPVVGSSSLNTITFQKNGIGANPVIYGYTGNFTSTSPTQDGIWRFVGTDYITVNGINLVDNKVSSPGTMEFGFGFYNASAYDGCQHNTLINCSVSMSRTVATAPGAYALGGARAIEMMNVLPASMNGSLNIASLDGSHSYNKFYANFIQNCSYGIVMNSKFSNPVNANKWNDIGGLSAISGNTIVNYGGSTITAVSGVYAKGELFLNIANNLINNNNGGGSLHTSSITGIYNELIFPSDISILNNTVTLKTATLNPSTICILNRGSAASYSVMMNGNLVTGCTSTVSASGQFKGIVNEADAAFLSMCANSFTNNIYGSSVGLDAAIINNGNVSGPAVFNNNMLSETNTHNSFGGNVYGIWNYAGSCGIVTFNNNIFTGFNLKGSGPLVKYISCSGDIGTLAFTGNSWLNNTAIGSYSTFLVYNPSSVKNSLSLTNNSVNGYTCTNTAKAWYGYYGVNFSEKQCAMTYSGNIFSNITGSGASSDFAAIYAADGYGSVFPCKKIYQNLLSNITYSNSFGTLYGIYGTLLGEGTLSQPSAVYSNTVSLVSGTGDMAGIYTNSTTTKQYVTKVYANVISGMTNTGINVTEIRGIQAYMSGSIDIYKNLVTAIVSTGSASAVGIMWGSWEGRANIFNNIVHNITAPNTGNTEAVNGIQLGYSAQGCTLSYNTVYLTGSACGSNGIRVLNSTPVTLKNNLVVNLLTPNGAGASTALKLSQASDYGLFSNNNLFYAGIPGPSNILVSVGISNNYTTMPSVKSGLGAQDQNSVSENTSFASLTPTTVNYMSISTASASSAESGAVLVAAIGDDFYGMPRNAATPDIGAVEGNYVMPAADALPPNVNDAGFTTAVCNLVAGGIFTAQITDPGGVAGGSLAPVLYYKVNSGSYSTSQGTLTTGSSTLGLWSFNLTYTAALGNVITYYMVAQDMAQVTNLVCYPPSALNASGVNSVVSVTAPGTYTLRMSLGGTYTVGTAGTFTSLSSAVNAYNTACLTGPVTFVLTNTLYTPSSFQPTTEVFPIVFLKNPDASATNSLLITPAAGVSATLSPQTMSPTGSLSAVFKFFGAQYVTIDGNTSGSSLTIDGDPAYQFFSNIWLASNLTTTNSHLAFRHLRFRNFNFGSPYFSYGLLACSDNTYVPNASGYNDDYITVSSNIFERMNVGISSQSAGNDNWIISDNLFAPTTTTGSPKLGSGISLENCSLFSIRSNTFMNLSDTYGSGAISLNQGSSSIDIDHNIIRSITSDQAYGIKLNTYLGNSNITIRNNMISNLKTFSGGGIQQTAVVGIEIIQTGGVKIHGNTIALSQTVTSNNARYTYCVYSDYSSGTDMRNNILNNSIKITAQNGTSRAYGFLATVSIASPPAFSHCDYNNYYVPNGSLATNGNAHSTVADLQQAFGENLNSVNLAPAFVSTVDPHLDLNALSNYSFVGLGTPLPGITDDIDLEQRSATTPVMGADEFTFTAPCAAANGGTINFSPFNSCETQSFSVKSVGASVGVGIVYQWQISSVAAGAYTNIAVGTGINTPTFNTSGQLPVGVYYLRLSAACPSASLTGFSNTVTLNVTGVPTLNIVQSGSIACGTQAITLTASGANSYTWSTGVNTSSIVITPTTSANYYILYRNSPCPADQSQLMQVYYSPIPVVNTSASNTLVCAGTPATLTATGSVNLNYAWSNGTTGSLTVVTPTSATVYSVNGYVNPGCVTTAVKNISVNATPMATINPAGTVTFCPISSVALTAPNNMNSYLWSNGAVTSSISVSGEGNYWVQVTDLNGCSATSASVTAINGLPQDFNSNGLVDVNDFILFVPKFATACVCLEDIDDDGDVDINDFLLFVPAFGSSCQ